MTEVACWAHTRRHFHKALDSDPSRMRTVLLLVAQLYRVEKTGRERGMAGRGTAFVARARGQTAAGEVA
jgi:hypothetical protein